MIDFVEFSGVRREGGGDHEDETEHLCPCPLFSLRVCFFFIMFLLPLPPFSIHFLFAPHPLRSFVSARFRSCSRWVHSPSLMLPAEALGDQ